MALIEAPRLFQMNHEAQKPSEAFFNPETARDDARLVFLTEKFVQSTVGLGDRMTVFEEGARQLGVKNDNREARLFAAYVREVMCGVIAGIECDISYREITFDHNEKDFIRGSGNDEEARLAILEAVAVARDKFSMEVEGDSVTHQMARVARFIELDKPEQVAAAYLLLGLAIAAGRETEERIPEEDYQLPLLDPELPY